MTDSLIQEKLTSILVMFAMFFLILSCKKSIPTGDVEGIVFFAGTNIPVAGVRIDVGGITSLSSEEGSYRIESITTGKQTLNAQKTGFMPFSTEITVQEGSITVLIPMISPAFSSSVQGIITGDFTGNPQAGGAMVRFGPRLHEHRFLRACDLV